MQRDEGLSEYNYHHHRSLARFLLMTTPHFFPIREAEAGLAGFSGFWTAMRNEAKKIQVQVIKITHIKIALFSIGSKGILVRVQ